MNRQYLEYIPEVGIPAANSHHGQQHQLHKQPECKAANLSNLHDAETCSSWADHVGGSWFAGCGLGFGGCGFISILNADSGRCRGGCGCSSGARRFRI